MQNASGLTDSILGPFCWCQNFWWQQVGLKERDLIWFGCQNRKYIISKVTSAAHTVWVCSSTAMVLVQFFNSLVLILITDSVVFFIVEFITQSVKRTSWGWATDSNIFIKSLHTPHWIKYCQQIYSPTSQRSSDTCIQSVTVLGSQDLISFVLQIRRSSKMSALEKVQNSFTLIQIIPLSSALGPIVFKIFKIFKICTWAHSLQEGGKSCQTNIPSTLWVHSRRANPPLSWGRHFFLLKNP